MTGYMIYPATTPRRNNAFSWFREAAEHHGISLKVFFYSSPGITPELEQEPLPDFVFMRGYNTLLSEWYELRGVKVLNTTASMRLCRDKLLAGQVLSAAGLPVPVTVAEPEFQDYASVSEALASPLFIAKMRFGSKGENVWLVEHGSDFREVLAQCSLIRRQRLSAAATDAEQGITPEEILQGSSLLFQEYIAPSRGKDIRVWVCGGEAVAHILRYNDHSFRSNFAQGGSFREIDLPENAARLAVEAADAAGLFFAGVDLLFDGTGGFKICEVNGNPGFRTASADIPDIIFSRIGFFC